MRARECSRRDKQLNYMRIKSIICSALAAGLLAGGLTACTTEREEADEGHEGKAARLEAQAKISRADAEKAALEKVPNGTIKEGELEKEKGKLIWSFDIATPGTKEITEVHVDARSGAVIDISKESAADQEKEMKEDANSRGKKEKEEDDEKDENK
jgi:uncharacterized membrane protein YkoI